MQVSQEQLAGTLGLTFQQVQKYEKGANRVSASKLFEVAKALGVEVSWFFLGLPASASGGDDATFAVHTAPALTAEGREVDRLLASMDPRQRRLVVNLARALGAAPAGAGVAERSAPSAEA